MKKVKRPFEIVFVDDGSTDGTFRNLKDIHKYDKRVKVVRLRGGWGKAVALQAGFHQAVGGIIITMDADLQDNPKEIPHFISKLEEGNDLVVGWKKNRKDPISKVISSRLYSFVSNVITGVKLHDVNCGFRAFRREVIENIHFFYGELFRLIPIIAVKRNFKVIEISVVHRPRRYGKSKYGFERALKGMLDLLTVAFLTRYTRKPGHFFGAIGFVSFSIGFIIGLYIAYLRVATGSIQYRYPLLFLGVLLMIMGVQFVSTGLLAEMITSFNEKQSFEGDYVAEVID
jgi:glycosyltransferase involved in cell wall biosynthesis